MPALGEYPDVEDTALAVLEQKGFAVWRNDDAGLFCAQRDGWDFMADSPISLLGLVAIYEHRQPPSYTEYWWRTAPERGTDAIPTTPPDYHPVWQR